MAADASIYSMIRPPQPIADPMESYGKALTLRSLMLQGQQAEKSIADERDVEEAARASGGDPIKMRDLLYGKGRYKPAMAIDKTIQEGKKTQAAIDKDNAAAGKSRFDVQIGQLERGASILSTARDQPSYLQALEVMAGTFGPDAVRQMPPEFDPAFVQASIARGMTRAQQLADERARETTTLTRARDAVTAANQPFTATGAPNVAVQDYKKDVAKKGATNVSVKTDVKTGESLAAQVGPMMKDSTSIAEGAVKQVDAARRIIQAVDSGKLVSGPGAEPILFVKQLAQTLGISGKDDAEIIANTRQAMRGMAELTLQGRQQMKGQGAITESEGRLAEKAMSADPNMTAAEIRQLARASERAARYNYTEHQRKLKVMQDNPDLSRVAPFYQGPTMAPEDVAEPAPGAPVVRRYNPQTGRIE